MINFKNSKILIINQRLIIKKNKIIRVTTISGSLDILLRGQLKYLSNFFNIIAISSPGPNLNRISLREGVPVIPIKISRPIKLIQDIASLYSLYKLFKFEKPKIVHSITPKAGLLSMCAAYLANVPIRMHTFTGLVFPSKHGFIKILLIQMNKLLCIFATHLYPEGNGVRNDLKHFGITNKPLKIIGNGSINGVNIKYFNRTKVVLKTALNIQNQLKIKSQDIVLCFIGRIAHDKGINELLEVFNELTKEIDNLKLLIVGKYEDEFDPISYNSRKIIDENKSIIITGFQDDIRPFLAMSDILILPSYREGFPQSVLQAGAMDVPCIVTDINGCNEIIHDNVNGLIIKPKDKISLKDAIKRLISNNDLKLTLSKNARKLILDRYEQKFVWNEVLKEYKRILYSL